MHVARPSLALLTAVTFASVSQAQQPQETLDQRDMRQAEVLSQQGKYEEAAALYQGVPQKYPTSPYIPGANLGAAVSLFFAKKYDEAVASAKKNFQAKNVPPEVLERSYVLVPQILTTKASELPGSDNARKAAFQDAIKGFDEMIAKFPASAEVETALYGKGRALASIDDFEQAAAVLKQAIDKFPKSPTLLDTKYLRGLVLYQQGASVVDKGGATPESTAALDEAEKAFREVIAARSDLVLMNDSFMQLGNVLFLKSSFAGKDGEAQKRLNEQALEQYREVRAKEEVVSVQERRLAFFAAQAEQYRVQNKMQEWKATNRLIEKEREKLETIKAQPDQSLEAKLKGGQVFLSLGKFDEARVMLSFTDGFLTDEDKDQKKRIGYFLAVTYAAQHVAAKAVEAYEKFTTGFGKTDPIAENLALLVGGSFLDPDPEINKPEEAIKYFREQIANYPKSKFSANAVMQEATALISLKRFEEAVKALDQTLKTQTDKELLMQAEFAMATVQREMGNNDQAIQTFKSVRDKYPGTEQAEQSAFWVGQIAGITGNNKTAIEELNAFIGKYPQSTLMANALYFKGHSQSGDGDYQGAVATFEELAQKFPKGEPTPPSMLEMAGILQRLADDAVQGKPDTKADYGKVHETVGRFIENYPDNERIFSAYGFDAQLFVKEEKLDEAIARLQAFIDKYPSNPDLAIAHLRLAEIWKPRAEKLGPFLALSKADQDKWKEWMENAVKNCEQGIEKGPESNAVSQLLDLQLKVETVRMQVGLKKPNDVKSYFETLAGKFEGKTTKSKILFALANFIADNDREKKVDWFDIMDKAFDPNLVYAPSDLDRYGNELVNRKKLDRAKEVVKKLKKDYPVPANSDPSKVSRSVGDGQSVSMALEARILQAEGKVEESGKILEDLKRFYPWSSKVAEADYGIGVSLAGQKKYEEAIDILSKVAKNNAAGVKIRAQSMMTIAKSLEELKKYDEAANNYIKIATFFEAERDFAAEGLWRGAQLLENLSTGKLVMAKASPAPAGAKGTPKAGAAKPASSGGKPATGAAKPATGAAKPANGAAKPANGAAKPATGAKPAAGAAK